MDLAESIPQHRWLRRPLLATLMQSPGACRLLAAILAGHFALMYLGYPGWRCPLLMATDHPCPGCGLSRSIMELGSGNLAGALALHAFGPLVGVALGLLVVSGFLPSREREGLTHSVARIEAATGLSYLLFVLFLGYWLARMVAGHGTIGFLA